MKKVPLLLFFVTFLGLAYNGYSQTTKSQKNSISSERSSVEETTPQTELKTEKTNRTKDGVRSVSDIQSDIDDVKKKIESRKGNPGADLTVYEDKLKKLEEELKKAKE